MATAYYEVLRPATDRDLEAAGPRIAAVLGKLPSVGYVSATDIRGRGARSAVSWACANGLLRKAGTAGGVLEFGTVRSWLSELGPTKTIRVANDGGTRHSYATALGSFNGWLRDRDLRTGTTPRSFSDVEDLLGHCRESDGGARAAGRILRQYLDHSAATGCSVSTALVRCAAVKSYLAAHDVHVGTRVERNRHRPAERDHRMSLVDLYKMMTSGGTDAMTKAVVMVKFQAGLDSSTLADRFNFEAYPQVVRHFGTDDYEAWDLSKCPVPIRLVRVKTNARYTTFIDRDAVSHLRDYLRWREFGGDKHEPGMPLFVTARGRPVTPHWVSRRFAGMAARAGIQARMERGSLRVRSHETRGPAEKHAVGGGVRALCRQPRARARPPGQLREAGRALPRGAAPRVLQSVGDDQHLCGDRGVPGDGGGPSRGEAVRGGGAAVRPGGPGPAEAGAGGHQDGAGGHQDGDRRRGRHGEDHGPGRGRGPAGGGAALRQGPGWGPSRRGRLAAGDGGGNLEMVPNLALFLAATVALQRTGAQLYLEWGRMADPRPTGRRRPD